MNSKKIINKIKILYSSYEKKELTYGEYDQELYDLISTITDTKEIRILIEGFVRQNIVLGGKKFTYHWSAVGGLFCGLVHSKNSKLDDLEFLLRVLIKTGWYSLNQTVHEKTKAFVENSSCIHQHLLSKLIKKTRSKKKLWQIHDFCKNDKRFHQQTTGQWVNCLVKIFPKISEQWEIEYVYKNASHLIINRGINFLLKDFEQRLLRKEDYWFLYNLVGDEKLLDMIAGKSDNPEEIWRVRGLVLDDQKREDLLKKYIDLKASVS